MSRRRSLEHHRRSLAEIREIMNSMKTLAYMETRKLARFLSAQQAVVQTMEDVAADFLSFHPAMLTAPGQANAVLLLIGSERGFCGDFNRALLRHAETAEQTHQGGPPLVIAVGRKLHTLLEGDRRVVAWIDGAGVVEEVPAVLNQLADEIVSLQSKHGAIEVIALHHGNADGVVTQRLIPPFEEDAAKHAHHAHPPMLNIPASEFFTELADQYLFAALHAMLYTSLMMENHDRVAHLGGAVRHLDEQSEDLTRQYNALRQEEIIEEIEVILLSAASLDGNPENKDEIGASS
jgi:F-type H+-transporting ATPase subunit gamma